MVSRAALCTTQPFDAHSGHPPPPLTPHGRVSGLPSILPQTCHYVNTSSQVCALPHTLSWVLLTSLEQLTTCCPNSATPRIPATPPSLYPPPPPAALGRPLAEGRRRFPPAACKQQAGGQRQREPLAGGAPHSPPTTHTPTCWVVCVPRLSPPRPPASRPLPAASWPARRPPPAACGQAAG